MIRTRIRPLAVALVAAAFGLAAVPANAGENEDIKSKVTIKKIAQNGASGKVASKKAKCERRRKVALLLADEYGIQRVGKDKTNRAGKWEIDAQLDGRYFARVKKLELPNGKVCKGDESPSRVV
jgi:hypothetical protein